VTGGARSYLRRAAGLAAWAYGVWLVITWTATAEQLVFGAVLAAATGVVMAPLGDVAGPWLLLTPRRAVAFARLAGLAAGQIVLANLRLTRRIWAPSRPLRSGMLIVPTTMRTDGEIAAAGLISSLVVDNQLVDLDRSREQLQYHVVAAPGGDRSEAINAPIERRVSGVKKG